MQTESQDIVFTKRPYVEDVGPRKIKNMQFDMLSSSEICKAGEVQVWNASYYDTRGQPVDGGLLDSRMGPANKSGRCSTCHGGFGDCPGHFGYLVLALPVYNAGYMSTIIDVLKCICKTCSRILLEEKLRLDYLKRMRSPKMDGLRKNQLMKEIVKKCTAMVSGKAMQCSRCGSANGTVKKLTGTLGIVHERSKHSDCIVNEFKNAIAHTKEAGANFHQATNVLNPVKVLFLFKRMTDEDCELLHLSVRPEDLIITSVPVPPIPIRPSVMVDGSRSNENDITERLKNIIIVNACLHQELLDTNTPSKCMSNWEALQSEVALFINSDMRICQDQANNQTTKKLSGLVQRLKGKQGRFRGNLSGKRVEYTGRTVISPDPNLKITEVGIPILMARILSYPERVSAHNIEKLRQCVRNGPSKYPGARMVRYPDGSARLLIGDYRKRLADELKYGCIVDRHLEDGDLVLFNRQPSLHRMSIMCHRARIMPWRTLRFNESVCNPYNADFDGDEMNMHVPQTEEARTEALMLMGVQNNLCTPKNGEILVASTQDFLTSSFLVTRKDTFYDRAAFGLMCSYMSDAMDPIDLPTPAILKPVELWTGKQLFNVLLRPNSTMKVYVNLMVKEKTYSRKVTRKLGNEDMEVETMCPNDGFVYFRNSELISGQLGKATLGNGNKDGLYSVLLRDYGSHAAGACMNRLAKLSARWIGNHGFSIGIDDVQPNKRVNDKKVETFAEDYQKCDDQIQKFNRGKLKLRPGCDSAQTLEANISEILNQIRDKTGKVCMDTLHWRNSPLIMSQCGSKGSPINISQMVACVGQQSVGGRRAPNGFIDRSLPHFPRKDKTPAGKGFVANSFYTGLTATEFFFHTMGGREGLVDTAVKTADTGYMSRRLIKALEDLSIQYDGTVRNASGCIVQFLYGDDGMDPVTMEGKSSFPLNFERMLLKVKATCPPIGQRYLSPGQITEFMGELLKKHDSAGVCSEAFTKSLRSFIEREKVKLEMSLKLADCSHRDSDLEVLTRISHKDSDLEVLTRISHKVYGITDKQLEIFVINCISRYRCKGVEYGTAIGVIGAHSIGEPGTQMTLKTFHFAGVASMNITQGVPRIREIINAAKKISTPIITAELEFADNVNSARMVKGRIEKTTLGQVAKSIEIVMTPRSASVEIKLDMQRIHDAHLCIDADIVREAILETPRIKLKQENVRTLGDSKLDVVPDADRSELYIKLHSYKTMLPSVVVKGIKTVERAVIAEKKMDSKHENTKPVAKKYQLLVEGTGLKAVMGTEGIEGRKTSSNHVMEVQEVLGIEAARTCIINEIKDVMGNHGMSIDIRHMMLLADTMTFRGEVLGITRYGIQKMDKNVLMLASFERTEVHLFGAAVTRKDDKIEGVSECIIMGIPMLMGTGSFKLMQRVDTLPLLNYGTDAILS